MPQCLGHDPFDFALGRLRVSPAEANQSTAGIGWSYRAIFDKPMTMNRSAIWLSILIAGGLAIGFAQTTPAEFQAPPDKIVSRIPREPVGSSAIASVGYSKRRQFLEIEFVNGAVYRYFSVPRSVYHKLMAAQSKARYYHENIRGNFKSLRIRRWQKQEARN